MCDTETPKPLAGTAADSEVGWMAVLTGSGWWSWNP